MCAYVSLLRFFKRSRLYSLFSSTEAKEGRWWIWKEASRICNPTLLSQNNTDRHKIGIYEFVSPKRIYCVYKEKCHPQS